MRTKKNAMKGQYVNVYSELLKHAQADKYQRAYHTTVERANQILSEVIGMGLERARFKLLDNSDEYSEHCYLGVMIKEVVGRTKNVVDGLQRFMTILLAILAHNDFVYERMPHHKQIPVPGFRFLDPVDQQEFAAFLSNRKKGTSAYHKVYKAFYSRMKANKQIIDEIADVIMNDIHVNMMPTSDGFNTFITVNTNHVELSLKDTILSYLKDSSYKYGISPKYNRNEIESIMAGYFYAKTHASYKFSFKNKDVVSSFIENNVVDTAEHFIAFSNYINSINEFAGSPLYKAMKDTVKDRVWKYAYSLLASGYHFKKFNDPDVQSLWAIINVSTFVQHGKSKTASFGKMIDDFTSNPNPNRVLKELKDWIMENQKECVLDDEQIMHILNEIPEKVQRGLRILDIMQANNISNIDCIDLSIEHAYPKKRVEKYFESEGWPLDEKEQDYLYKHFGNTCLIPQSKNSECGNHAMTVKDCIYSDLFANNAWLATTANMFDAKEYANKKLDYANNRSRLFVEALRSTPMGDLFIHKRKSFDKIIITGGEKAA